MIPPQPSRLKPPHVSLWATTYQGADEARQKTERAMAVSLQSFSLPVFLGLGQEFVETGFCIGRCNDWVVHFYLHILVLVW
jgi:hypothetical protein